MSEQRPESGDSIFTRTQYDNLLRPVFTSRPSFSQNETKGVETHYDALSRVTATIDTSDPSVNIATRYLSNNRIEVTNARGYTTTTKRTGFANPNDGDVAEVVNPISTTVIARDIWNNPLSVTQKDTASNGNEISATQRYFYDAKLRLCRTSVPETGDTVLAYNNANQKTHYVAGLPAGNSCQLPGDNRVAYRYNALGQITNIDYPGTTSDITQNYDANGNITLAQNSYAKWDYDYGILNELKSETITLDNKPYRLGYAYTPAGLLNAITLPNNHTLAYNTDGFGRPTTITGYINRVDYYPTGSPKTVEYVNGVTQEYALNERQLPSNILVNKASQNLKDISYAYDANANVTAITDHLSPSYNNSMIYDSLDRLKEASGKWGEGEITYDALGNIRYKKMGNHALSYTYDARNRLSNVNDSNTLIFTYDNYGNVTENMKNGFLYNHAQQMVSTSHGYEYTYDAYGKRVKKIKDGKTEYFIYSKAGQLMYKEGDGIATDYIYLNNKLIAKDKHAIAQ